MPVICSGHAASSTDLRKAEPGRVTSFSMGMSVGWGDNYYWTLPGQSIDITGLPDGEYLLESIADPDDWFDETDETNNRSWARIWLSSDPSAPGVEIIESGIDHEVPAESP